MSPSYLAAYQSFQRVNENVKDFLAFALAQGLANGFESLPDGFDIASAGWQKAEAEIENAIATNNVNLVTRLCREYETRAAKYLTRWRVIISNQAQTGQGATIGSEKGVRAGQA